MGRTGGGGAVESPGEHSQGVEVELPALDGNEGEELTFAPEADVRARRLKITREDLEDHGPTQGCGTCEDVLAGKPHTRAHTEECRKRFVELLGRIEVGRRRLDAEERRLTESITRVQEAYLRRSEARMDARDAQDAERQRAAAGEAEPRTGVSAESGNDGQDSGMPSPVGQPEPRGPAGDQAATPTSTSDKAEYDRQLRETLRYLRSGRSMPDPTASSSSAPGSHARKRQAMDDGYRQHKSHAVEEPAGQKRGAEDDGDNAHKIQCTDAVDAKEDEQGLSDDELCKVIATEVPDLAEEWSTDVPELASKGQAREGGSWDDPRVATGTHPTGHPGRSNGARPVGRQQDPPLQRKQAGGDPRLVEQLGRQVDPGSVARPSRRKQLPACACACTLSAAVSTLRSAFVARLAFAVGDTCWSFPKRVKWSVRWPGNVCWPLLVRVVLAPVLAPLWCTITRLVSFAFVA